MIPEPAEPRALFWYKIYCFGNAALQLIFVVAGVAIRRFDADSYLQQNFPDSADQLRQTFNHAYFNQVGVSLILTGFAFCAINAIAPFLPRAKWAYQAHFVNLILGLCVCFPACIPLLIMWTKPDVRAYYQS